MGTATGAGTDVVLVKHDPAGVPAGTALARQVQGKIKHNLLWAAIYTLLALPCAAALLMRASPVIVTASALLLRS